MFMQCFEPTLYPIDALKCSALKIVLIENVSTLTDLFDGEESNKHHELMEEVISQLSTHFVKEISQPLDTCTTVKEMIARLKLEYVVTTFQTDVNHPLLEISANDQLMAFVSSHKKLFIATYDNIINTSEKLESKRWTKLHAAIHSYVSSESSTLK